VDGKPIVLLVEDDPVDAALAERALESAGEVVVDHCTTLGQALARLADASRPAPTVVLLDLSLPDARGVETFDRLAAVDPPPVVVISGDDDPACARSLIERGAQDYLVKGEMSDAAVLRALRQAVERARLRGELQEARDRAVMAARSQSAFVAAMSHEIRTPLNAILGMADLLAQTPLDLDQREYVEIFRRCGRGLKGMLDNALELARLETGELTLHEAPFDLEALVYECLEAFAFSAHRKGVALVADVPGAVGGTAHGDDARLRQVLLNLLGNAVKFTEAGRVVLRVSACDIGVEIAVTDTGVGIPADRLDAIFERFVQAEAGTTRRFGGTGLGLALSRELVEIMQGEIRVESEVGQGSCFRLRLPMQVAPRGEVSRFDGERVLLSMGDPVERGVLARQLRDRGARVVETETTGAARDALSGDRFDAMLLDARLPGSGGVAWLEHAELPPPDETRRIVLLPMDHRVGDLSRCAEVDAVALGKPLRWAELDRALRGLPIRDETPQRSETAPRLEHARILLAEDSPENRTIALAHLAATGCQVEVVVDGEEAVERWGVGDLDLVLMDVHMPVVDGREATRRIRALEASQDRRAVPIVALTADALPAQRAACLEAGCDAHLSKPFGREDLYRVLRRFLAESSPTPETEVQRSGAGSPAQDHYDIPPELADLAEDYLERRRADAGAIRGALSAGDFETARRLGHNMKGSGGGYGFARISALGSDIQRASEGRDAASIERLADELSEYAEKTLASLADEP